MGYVSPDLYGHPITRFVLPVFEHHDRSRFEVFAYAVGSTSDHITEYFRKRVDHFVTLPADEKKLASRIRADGIDILVDLAGHTTGDAYLAFARKPAPIQISWLGVLSTTGLSTMDYFLGDAEMPCPGTDHLFSETVHRLPRAFCGYRPATDVPVAPAPYLANGDITFGCFNSPRKITREVVKLWSAILHLVSGGGSCSSIPVSMKKRDKPRCSPGSPKTGFQTNGCCLPAPAFPLSILKSTAGSILRWTVSL